MIVFTFGDSRTAVFIDENLVALTGRGDGNGVKLTSWIGVYYSSEEKRVHQNRLEDISIIRIPKKGNITPLDTSRIESVSLNTFIQNLKAYRGIKDIGTEAINSSLSDDDKTIVITKLRINNRDWVVASFSDGVFPD
ncbi:MAG: hypothetical protein N2482_01385 [Patescibacteria group bacterium]|nr:hypothetical protein [Patescibacteria group bacterium]